MQEFFPFFIILLVAVVFSQLFLRMKIPWVVALIFGGIIVGPNGIGWFQTDNTIDFLAEIGLVMLMFMAGVESKLTDMKGLKKRVAIIALLIGILPTLVGVTVTTALGYDWTTSILMGIIFMSSAIALLIPSFEQHNIMNSDLGKVVVASAIIVDAFSLILLSVFLQFANGTPTLGSILIYPLALALLGVFAWIIPKIRWIALSDIKGNGDIFEKELRFTLLTLVSLVVFFEFVGLHAIIAGFFAGMILSKSMGSTLLHAKLHAISYGFFIPVFFVVVGASTDLSVFTDGLRPLLVMLAVVSSSALSKFASGWLAGRLTDFSYRSSAFIGVSVTPHLSTALAVAFLGFGEGLLTQELLSSVIGLTVVTSVLSPIFVNLIGRKIVTQKPQPTVSDQEPVTAMS
jgi:Kef-type K+ transport system membrane component KefB